MNILVVGGAGYIGSHMVKTLHDEGHQVMVLDDLSTGFEQAVLGGNLFKGGMENPGLLDELFSQSPPQAVMHFASFIQVGESVRDPAKYYQNNVAHTLVLLEAMRRHHVRWFIFSSSAAIFGNPEYTPIDERHPIAPINPYGRSKWMVEQMLADYDRAYGIRSTCLRYFNASGAHPLGILGERHNPETHLIPLILKTAAGERPQVDIYGQDYPTPDGTCVRDYIHVIDICQAHSLALRRLIDTDTSTHYNLGNGTGFSVRQVIDTARLVTGRNIPVSVSDRRPGDPAVLVADSKLIRQELGWTPKYADLETIIRHAWQWENHPV